MSYRQLCSSAGLGFDWNATKQEGISTVTQANADYVNQAVDKMSVPAVIAGPISKAEQDAVGLILERGTAGKLPTPAEMGNILKNAGVSVVAGAAGVACGPAAPLCAAGAAYLTNTILGSITGSGGGCGHKINGMCANDYWAAYKKAVMAKCPPGSVECRDKLNNLWNKVVPALVAGQKAAYEDWAKKCDRKFMGMKVKPPASCFRQCPEPRSTIFGADSNCVAMVRVRQHMNGPSSWDLSPDTIMSPAGILPG